MTVTFAFVEPANFSVASTPFQCNGADSFSNNVLKVRNSPGFNPFPVCSLSFLRQNRLLALTPLLDL
jgi:hypothetical protein